MLPKIEAMVLARASPQLKRLQRNGFERCCGVEVLVVYT